MSKEKDVFPLLQSQLDIFRAWKADPGRTAYNLPAVLPFPKTFGADRLFRALRFLVAHRPALHLRFVEDKDGEPRQIIKPSQNSSGIVLRSCSEQEALGYMDNGFVRPFNLLDGTPLFRFEVLETPLHNYVLLDVHHSIADGYTLARNLVGRDLAAALAATAPEPPQSPPLIPPGGEDWLHGVIPPKGDKRGALGLREAVETERSSFQTPAYERARAYYRELFEGVEFLRFGQTNTDATGEAVVAVATVQKSVVDDWCRAHGVSAAHLFLAAFSLVVARLKRRSRVAFFCLNHGRTDRRLLGAYGMFVKSVPVVVGTRGDQSLDDYLRHVRRQLLSSFRHSIYPASHFCRDLHVSPSVTFAFQGEQISEVLQIDGTTIVGRQLPHGQVRNDLGCLVYGKNDQYEIRTDSSSALNSPSTLDRVARAVKNCVMAILQNGAGMPLSNICLATPSEQKRLMRLGRGERLKYNQYERVLDLILRQARLTPDALAVADGNGEFTYSQIDVLSSNLSRELKAQGLASGQFACLLSGARKEFLVWVLAVWRAGGAYVPIDSAQPSARLNSELAHSAARIILSDHALQAVEGYRQSVTLSLDGNHLYVYTRDKREATPCGDEREAAYMMFTSGSTGVPKGVVVSHGAVLNLVHFLVRRWQLTAKSRISCHSSFAFDASVEDLFPVLTVGGSVHIVPDDVRRDIPQLHAFLTRQRITGGCFTTRLGLLLADYAPLPLQYICLGGELLTRRPPTQARVLNTYGPTECTVDATWCELPGDNRLEASIPIGRPLDNMQAYVTDEQGQLLPQGAVGELCLAGPQLALGYWRQPQLTAERFVESKFGAGRIYRTGDLVRWGNDGQLYFVGRSDQQVKLNGYRVELSEIEHALRRVEGIKEAVVVAQQHNGQPQLRAYCQADAPIGSEQMGEALSSLLPSYMLPHIYIKVEQWPLLASGKIDIARLPQPASPSFHAEESLCQSESECLMCSLFAQVLQVPSVRPTDNFFQLGGTSLSVMQLVVEAGHCGLSLVYGDIYRWPTPRQLVGKKEEGTAPKAPMAPTAPLSSPEGDTNASSTECAAEKTIVSPSGDERGAVGASGAVASLLLTGATGLLGSHLLRELLLHGEADIYCLVRSKNGISGRERLMQTMNDYFLDTWPVEAPPLSELLERKVRVVEGDLTHADAFRALAEVPVGKVIHCAADVRHFASDDALVAVNVEGTQRVVDFCLQKGCPLVHVSTVSVVLGGGNDYVRTKVAAEQLVLRAVNEHRLKAQIMRIGNLMPRLSDGRYQSDAESNALLASLRLLKEMRVYPAWLDAVRIDFTPVDCAAKALLAATASEAPEAPPSAPEGATNASSAESAAKKTIVSPSGAVGGASGAFTICHPVLHGVGSLLRDHGGCRPIGDADFMQRITDMPASRRKVALYGLLGSLAQIAQKAPEAPRSPESFPWPQLPDDYLLRLLAD